MSVDRRRDMCYIMVMRRYMFPCTNLLYSTVVIFHKLVNFSLFVVFEHVGLGIVKHFLSLAGNSDNARDAVEIWHSGMAIMITIQSVMKVSPMTD